MYTLLHLPCEKPFLSEQTHFQEGLGVQEGKIKSRNLSNLSKMAES